ncbi:MAG: dynamin family protein [Thermodesulfobacteriota bacterium]
MDANELQQQLKLRVEQKLRPLFNKYDLDFTDLEAALKWKPMVLLIGNYSSGKSTLINELVGEDIQRTGQAPTDDSFTIITHEGEERAGEEVPGSSLVNDEEMPFTAMKSHGDQFISHFRMRKVAMPELSDIAIIDSPGMLDAVTENDRGYDYMAVISQLAKLADLVVLMFDPHKAGTIKETYTAIRDTLPASADEDRIIFVMNRIDECDSTSDLVRSFGTLCWNLSQMTGRKDIPHVFLTYAPGVQQATNLDLDPWTDERCELTEKIFTAPTFRVYHVLQDIDRQVAELQLISEAMASFSQRARALAASTLKFTGAAAIIAFFFTGLLSKIFLGFPDQSLVEAILTSEVTVSNFAFPLAGLTLVTVTSWAWLSHLTFPRFLQKTRAEKENLIPLNSNYRRNVWSKVEANVDRLVEQASLGQIFGGHNRNLSRIKQFIQQDLANFYNDIRE